MTSQGDFSFKKIEGFIPVFTRSQSLYLTSKFLQVDMASFQTLYEWVLQIEKLVNQLPVNQVSKANKICLTASNQKQDISTSSLTISIRPDVQSHRLYCSETSGGDRVHLPISRFYLRSIIGNVFLKSHSSIREIITWCLQRYHDFSGGQADWRLCFREDFLPIVMDRVQEINSLKCLDLCNSGSSLEGWEAYLRQSSTIVLKGYAHVLLDRFRSPNSEGGAALSSQCQQYCETVKNLFSLTDSACCITQTNDFRVTIETTLLVLLAQSPGEGVAVRWIPAAASAHTTASSSSHSSSSSSSFELPSKVVLSLVNLIVTCCETQFLSEDQTLRQMWSLLPSALLCEACVCFPSIGVSYVSFLRHRCKTLVSSSESSDLVSNPKKRRLIRGGVNNNDEVVAVLKAVEQLESTANGMKQYECLQFAAQSTILRMESPHRAASYQGNTDTVERESSLTFHQFLCDHFLSEPPLTRLKGVYNARQNRAFALYEHGL